VITFYSKGWWRILHTISIIPSSLTNFYLLTIGIPSLNRGSSSSLSVRKFMRDVRMSSTYAIILFSGMFPPLKTYWKSSSRL